MSQPAPWLRSFGREASRDSLRIQRQTDLRVRRLLNQAARDVRQILTDSLGGPGLSQTTRQRMFDNSRAAIARVERQLWLDLNTVISGGVQDITGLVGPHQSRLLRLLGEEVSDKTALSALRLSAESLAEEIRARLLAEYDLSALTTRNALLMQSQVEALVRQGIASSMTTRQIVADLGRMIRPTTPGGTSFNALRLSRTELNNAFQQVSREAYNGNDWVEAGKWELSGSHPEQDVCDDLAEDDSWGLGSGVFPTEQIPVPPHPHCLCFISPVTVSRKEFARQLSSP